MKKFLIAGFLFLSLAVPASADNVYFGINLGAAGSNNFDDVQDIATKNGISTDLNDSNGLFGIEAGYETPAISKTQLLGARLGFTWHSEIKLESTQLSPVVSDASSAYTIPLSFYYKHLFEDTGFALLGGVGITFINTVWESKIGNLSNTTHKNKTAPHLLLGAEYNLSEHFSIGLDLKYAVNSEVKADEYKRDFDFQGALAARYYL